MFKNICKRKTIYLYDCNNPGHEHSYNMNCNNDRDESDYDDRSRRSSRDRGGEYGRRRSADSYYDRENNRGSGGDYGRRRSRDLESYDRDDDRRARSRDQAGRGRGGKIIVVSEYDMPAVSYRGNKN